MNLLKTLYKRKDAVIVISGILLVTKLLGFFKVRIIAGSFGATQELDIFWAAFMIPDTIFNVLVAGTINAAVIPIFSDVLYDRGEKSLVKLMSTTVFLLSIVAVVVTGLLMIFAGQISELMVSSWYVEESFNLANDLNQESILLMTRLMRIMLISPLLLGVSAIVTAFLQVHKKFFITTLAPLVYNFGIIVGTLLFVEKYDRGVTGLAWAVVLGSVLHLLVQAPITIQFIRNQLNITSLRKLNGEAMYYVREVGEMVKLAIPRVLSFIGEQFNVIFNTIVAFSLTGGALSSFKFAISLHFFPIHIISGAISQIALPNFAESYSKGNLGELVTQFNDAIRKTYFIIIPSVVVLVVLRLPIVRLAFGTGAFDWWDTVITSWVLALLGFAIVGQSLVALVLRALYAVHETKLPLITTVVTIIINITATYYLTNFFSHYFDWRPIIDQINNQLTVGITEGGFTEVIPILDTFRTDLWEWFTTRNVSDAAVGGLALSLSLAFMVELFMNGYFLNRKIRFMNRENLIKPLFKMSLNAFVMMIAMYLVFRFSDFSLDTTKTLSVFFIVVLTSAIGASVYLAMGVITGVKEVRLITYWASLLLGKLQRSLKLG